MDRRRSDYTVERETEKKREVDEEVGLHNPFTRTTNQKSRRSER